MILTPQGVAPGSIFRTFLAAVSLALLGPGPGTQQGKATQATRARANQEYAQKQQGRRAGIGAKAARPQGGNGLARARSRTTLHLSFPCSHRLKVPITEPDCTSTLHGSFTLGCLLALRWSVRAFRPRAYPGLTRALPPHFGCYRSENLLWATSGRLHSFFRLP